MDFVKKILHQMSRKSEAVSQITFDEDYNVPDARPDVGRMIQKKGEVTIGDVQISEGKARVFGGLTFHLLYVSDGERRRICQLSGELPIDELIDALRSINYDGFISLEWDVAWLPELADMDIIFSHFVSCMSRFGDTSEADEVLYQNRAGTGNFIWKKETLVDLTFS